MIKTEGRIAFFAPSLRGGGAERVMLTLASEFCRRGLNVDFVLAKAEGQYLSNLPNDVRLVDLGVKRVAFSFPGLVKYLKSEKPVAMLSTLNHANCIAVLAKRFAGVNTRLVIREANTVSKNSGKIKTLSEKFMPVVMKYAYPRADYVVAVSHGVKSDLLAHFAQLDEKIGVIYSPVVTSEMLALAEEKPDHPWFQDKQTPIVLGVGRLTCQKGFDTLVKAFSEIESEKPVRLMILGEGEDRANLQKLVDSLGLSESVSLPGFVDNPFAFMKSSDLYVLSSRWEGLPNTLIQALAVGCPVMSTNCPSGPNEILENGKWGTLVEVDDVAEMAKVMGVELSKKKPESHAEVSGYCMDSFGSSKVADHYLSVLLPGN